MKKTVFPTIILGVLLLAAFPCMTACSGPSSAPSEQSQKQQSKHARQLPVMNLTSSNKGDVKFADVCDSKAIIIDVWASWCGPCCKQIPILHELKDKYGSRLAIVGISVDDSEKDHKKAIKKLKINYPSCLAKDNINAQYLDDLQKATGQRIEGIPHLVIADGKGNIVYARSGVHSKKHLEKILDPLMKTKN